MGKILNPIQDAVLGKKDPGRAPATIDMNTPEQTAMQGDLLNQYKQFATKDYGAEAQAQTNLQEEQARQGVVDQQARARQMIAQRGLGNTSIGLNAVLAPEKSLGQDIAKIRANQPLLANQLRQQGLGFASKGMGDIWAAQSANKIYQPGQASQGRQGGLLVPALGILGAVGGSVAGHAIPGMGAAGAKMGMGIGQALQNV